VSLRFRCADYIADSHIASSKRVMSLKEPQLKMSKSHEDPRSRISLSDTPIEIHGKIKSALTDSLPGLSYDPISRPGVSNLLDILSCFDSKGRSAPELAQEYASLDIRSFKDCVARNISDSLAGFRQRYAELTEEGRIKQLDDVAEQGAQKARVSAAETMVKVRESIGI
jgi:tryptophanyl-tRNA synthetase